MDDRTTPTADCRCRGYARAARTGMPWLADAHDVWRSAPESVTNAPLKLDDEGLSDRLLKKCTLSPTECALFEVAGDGYDLWEVERGKRRGRRPGSRGMTEMSHV